MPRYFFDIHDGIDLVDLEGTDCTGIEQVRFEGKSLLPRIALDQLPRGPEKKTFVLRVRDDSGHVVYKAKLDFESD